MSFINLAKLVDEFYRFEKVGERVLSIRLGYIR